MKQMKKKYVEAQIVFVNLPSRLCDGIATGSDEEAGAKESTLELSDNFDDREE